MRLVSSSGSSRNQIAFLAESVLFPCFHPCLSVCIRGSNLICSARMRVLYMIAACGRPNWNPRDANIKSLAPAARFVPHGYHGQHTKNSARAGRAETGEALPRGRALGRANAQVRCRSMKRSGNSSPSGPTALSFPPKAKTTRIFSAMSRKSTSARSRSRRKARPSASCAARCTPPRS